MRKVTSSGRVLIKTFLLYYFLIEHCSAGAVPDTWLSTRTNARAHVLGFREIGKLGTGVGGVGVMELWECI